MASSGRKHVAHAEEKCITPKEESSKGSSRALPFKKVTCGYEERVRTTDSISSLISQTALKSMHAFAVWKAISLVPPAQSKI